ncbi:MAG: DUF1343 domain-containing protein [Cyclobacteriaceae bacterium]|nr:DUF1343 domain-containing protein [Cyclobacteriaceae bacterium]
MIRNIFFGYLLISLLACASAISTPPVTLLLGDEQLDSYLPLLQGKNTGLCVNHTSLLSNGTHLVDTLLSLGIRLTAVYTPEHGFRGTADAGELIENQNTNETFRIESLYGKNKKPSPEMLQGIEVMVFDIQDVGARFYTYISTMHYVMEACAEQNIPIIILDRPNPNGHYTDGPILDTAFHSFVGMHPIPVVHGLTTGELARMINGEGWLTGGRTADLTVVPMQNWTHQTAYSLPVKPSPNLPNDQSIALYPSLCFFEGTVLSVGRGTSSPFQVVGHPEMEGDYAFVPDSTFGAKSPKLKGEHCRGKSFADTKPANQLDISYLITAYQVFNQKNLPFFTNYFNTLAGTDQLRKQIEAGMDESQIRASWQPGLEQYKALQKQYVLYP